MTGVPWLTRAGAERIVARTWPLFGTGPVLGLGTGGALVQACLSRGIPARDVEASAIGGTDAASVVFVSGNIVDCAMAAELRRVAVRDLFVLGAGEEPAALLDAGFCRHPRSMRLTSYEAMERGDSPEIMAYRALPASADAYPRAWLERERDLHMDMLRETGRRADAHIARYALACDYVRLRDRVLDVACGMGYGAAILREGTYAESIVGLDSSATAIEYARQAHAGAASFECEDADVLDRRADGSVDVVVSFETIEHLAQPRAFVEQVSRLLTPGGRFICSVPNRWVDEDGRDPNPHHLHVFDLERLRALCAGLLREEKLYAQTAGGGMKCPGAPRTLRESVAGEQDADPEWWVLVAIKDPASDTAVPYRDAFAAPGGAPAPTPISFERDYANPWLARALVSRGLRATSRPLLDAMARDVLATAPDTSADYGAALCVRAYVGLGEAVPDAALDAALERFEATPPGNPHVERWRISNVFVLALRHLHAGRVAEARATFERCAALDCLRFSPLIATKTVEAAFHAGWLAVQAGDFDAARRSWTRGVHEARRAIAAPWDDVLGTMGRPLLFGMRELAEVLDVASTCASGLHQLDEFAERPGLAAEETWRSRRHDIAALEEQLWATRESLAATTAALEDRDTELARLRGLALRRRELLHALTDASGVVVFGAGEGGRQAADMIERFGGRVTCLLDNRTDYVGTVRHGHVVRAPSDLPELAPALVVIASSIAVQEMTVQVLALGVACDKVVTGADLAELLGAA